MSTRKREGKKHSATMYDHVRMTKDEWYKPDSLVLYDHTEGGVDVVDLVLTQNIPRNNHKRWPMNALAVVLDAVRTNAKTILQEYVSQIKMSSFNFTYMLGKMLILPLIERGYASPNGLPSQLVNKI